MFGFRASDIDLRLVLIAVAILYVGLVVFFFRLRRRLADVRGLSLFVGVLVCPMIGFLLLALRNMVLDFVSIVVANFCVLMSGPLLINCFRRMAKRSDDWLSPLTLCAGGIIIVAYFTEVHRSVDMRVAATSTLLAVMALMAILDVMAVSDAGFEPRFIVILSLIIYIVAMAFRAYISMAHPSDDSTSMFDNSSVHHLGLVFGAIVAIGVSSGVYWAALRIARTSGIHVSSA